MTERMLIRHPYEMVEDEILLRHDKKERAATRLLLNFAVRHDARAGAPEDL
jgi:hypothetical protein